MTTPHAPEAASENRLRPQADARADFPAFLRALAARWAIPAPDAPAVNDLVILVDEVNACLARHPELARLFARP
ncbi:hypothetical protein ACFZBU_39665 [Embleya sp. NPDC008237]|uniref:hypothetical protein n=1 Tax=Embleya sp. NPDC008237 TaxID=3363978 RepID=UPI0036E54744